MAFLTSLFTSWLTSPWLLLAGALAISVPIIIHLLNKRRFRTVDWAAMDFLIEADRKNRRRVRLENLLLLLLRCLAVLLVGLLLARPFLRPSFASRLFDTAQFERIVLLDDSLSMQTQVGAESAMEQAKRSLISVVRSLADDQSDDTLTLLLTSRPDTPLVNGVRVTPESVDELVDRIETLEASDLKANLGDAFREVERIVNVEASKVNRVVYVVTDMRQHDWEPKEGEGQHHPAVLLAELAKETAGCYLLDVGSEETGNLIVTGIRPEDNIVAGTLTRFVVSVANLGREEARDVQVRLIVGDGETVPLTASIDQIPAGQTASVPISFTFVRPPATGEAAAGPDAQQVRAEVVTATAQQHDRLSADSTAFFPARVVPGIPTLLVDGDPSAAYARSETFFLRRALAPPGDEPSGFAVEVATETELETVPLEKYQVIFLCNLYRLSERRIEALEKWVQAGGGLVMTLGDQVDEDFFNQHFFKEGKGLSPVRLEGLRGDETRATWVGLQVDDAQHRMLRDYAGQSNPLLESMQFFRWWETAPAEGQPVQVPARFTDESRQPAIIEQGYEKGRVIVVATPADEDWSNWIASPGYITLMLDMSGYMAGNMAGRGELRVGEPIRQAVDLTRYRIDAALEVPGKRRVSVKASPEDDSPDAAAPAESETPSTVWQVQYEETQQRGFYDLQLTRTDGAAERLLFSANVDPKEGDLRRADRAKLDRQFDGAPIKIIRGEDAVAQQAVGSQSEIWKYVLVGLVGILLGEQVLGWWFGRKR
jgi:hypothetical protein